MVADGYCKKCGAIADVTPVESGALLCDDCLGGNVTVAAAAFKLIDKFESQGGIKYSQAGDRNPENGSTDCSGWVCYLSKSQGVEIPNTTGPMYKHFEKKTNFTILSNRAMLSSGPGMPVCIWGCYM